MSLSPSVTGVPSLYHLYERGSVPNAFTEIENVDASSSSFSLDYTVLIKQINYYQQKGKSFLGIFHTHPLGHSLLPSKKDRYYMQYWPSPFVWLIGAFSQVLAFEFSFNKVYQIPYTVLATE